MKNIYLDYAAATPAAPEVIAAMMPYFTESFGNSSSLHSFGQDANKAVDDSREIISKELGASFREIIFTASATEANNAVLRGLVRKSGKDRPQVIISAIEHESVFETVEDLEKDGAEVVTIPVSQDGIIDIEKLSEALSSKTALVSVIYASNVIGIIQPIAEIGKIIKKFREGNDTIYPMFHVDAVQAFPFFKLSVEELGVDALTLSGQKIYGPKGTGILYLRENWAGHIAPYITGGTQEFNFRAGTVNTPAVVGLAKAVRFVSSKRDEERERIEKLRDNFWKGLKESVPDVELNGSFTHRLPNNLHVYFPGMDGGELITVFDQAGIAVSTGSACSVRAAKPSHAVMALGFDKKRASESIRFTLGYSTTKREIDNAIERITKLLLN